MSENPNKTKVISLRLSDENEKILQGIEEATGKSMNLDADSLREAMMKIVETETETKKVTEDTISSLRASLWQKKTRL